jgi:uncharacterized phiE125 gp8 family phage protein
MPSSVVITAPDYASAPVLSLAEAKSYLKVPYDDEDDLIETLIAALAEQTESMLQRALRPQTRELRLDGFPCGAITLDYPPLIGVESLTYVDGDGEIRMMVEGADFRVLDNGEWPAEIAPSFGRSWPAARADERSVLVRYQCGYDPDAEGGDSLPKRIKARLHLALGALFDVRAEFVTGTIVAKLPDHILNMLAPLKVY